MSMNHESTVNHWPPIINNRSTPCYLTPVYSDVLLGSFSGVIFFATLLSAVWLHHQYILHHNINLLIIHFHSTNRNILRVHCVFRWNFTDLSSLIGLEQQNNTSSSQITCTNLHDYIHSIQVSNMIYKKKWLSDSRMIMVRFQIHFHLVNCPLHALQFLQLNQVSNDPSTIC